MRVLLLDGSARIRARLAQRLTGAGAEVREAADLSGALAVVGSFSPDAIVLDLHVDADTGIPGLLRLRGAAPAATIVVLTNEAGEVQRRECIRHGADFFLDKSRDFDRAIELISER